MKIILPVTFLFFFCFEIKDLRGQPVSSFEPETYMCFKTDTALFIDGIIDEQSWEKAPWTNNFVDIEGNLKPTPLHRTRVKMLWDNNYFYLAAELIEPDIWATYTERDAVIYHENDFEVFIDPDGDTHHYYELEINALGTVWDLLLSKPYRDKGEAINSWDIDGLLKGINVEGTLNDPSDVDNKWMVELGIPWNALKEASGIINKPTIGDQWRVNFSRVNWQLIKKNGKYEKRRNPKSKKSYPEYNWVWSAQGVIAMHQPETWGYVQFANTGDNVIVELSPDENIKWVLRQIYYGEWQYHKIHLSFTDDLEKLDRSEFFPDGFSFSPKLVSTSNSFLAQHKSYDGKSLWQIREDGRIWKIKVESQNDR